MGFIKRIQKLVGASINDLLEKAENPEAMLNQMVRDLERSVGEMRKNTASAIATARLTEKKLDRANGERDVWQEYAENAVKEGNDDLAKKALLRRRTIEDNILILSNQLVDAKHLGDKMTEELKLVEGKLQESKLKRDNLVMKKRTAETMQKLYEDSSRFDSLLENALGTVNIVLDGYEGFGRFEEKIERQMAELEARDALRDENLEKEFHRMKRDRDLDNELSALKKKVLV